MTDSQVLVEEGLLLICEEIRGKMGERQKERPLHWTAYKSKYIGNDNCCTLDFFYMPAPYLSPCSRCHTIGYTAKSDLVMLHPGQTFLTLSLANLSVHTLLLIFYHECWLQLLLLLNLFVINLVFSWVHPVLMPGLFPYTVFSDTVILEAPLSQWF